MDPAKVPPLVFGIPNYGRSQRLHPSMAGGSCVRAAARRMGRAWQFPNHRGNNQRIDQFVSSLAYYSKLLSGCLCTAGAGACDAGTILDAPTKAQPDCSATFRSALSSHQLAPTNNQPPTTESGISSRKKAQRAMALSLRLGQDWLGHPRQHSSHLFRMQNLQNYLYITLTN